MTPADFLALVGPMAREAHAAHGVPASVTLAQAILESGWGESELATKASALFGIKYGTKWHEGLSPYVRGAYAKVSAEFIDGFWVRRESDFCRYASWRDSVMDHGLFLHRAVYAGAWPVTTADAFARAIHAAGYATDPGYSDKLIALMDAHNLRAYDTTEETPMPRTVDETDLEQAFAYAITRTRADGRIHLVDDRASLGVDWRNNIGSRTNRITRLYGAMTHHTGSEIAADRIVSYVRQLAVGAMRPEIGANLCNTATVRAGVWPGSGFRPTICVLNDNYSNNAGMIDQRILDELLDGDVDGAGEFRPSGDDLYGNRFFWGDEGVGARTDAGQQLAFIVFYCHALAFLGLHVDTDKDGRFAAMVAHREGTQRKVDPVGADMVQLRAQAEQFWAEHYGVDLPGVTPADPLVVSQPLPGAGDHLVVDGVFSRRTIARLQDVVGAKADGIWGPDSKRKTQAWLGVTVDGAFGRRSIKALQERVGATVDGVWGRRTTEALQRHLNGLVAPAAPAATAPMQLAEDGVLGPRTITAMQRWVGTAPDGVWGTNTTRALQTKVGARVDGVRGPDTIRRTQAAIGASVDGLWGSGTTRALQRFLNGLGTAF